MRSKETKRSGLRKVKQRGSEMLEFTLVLLPCLGFVFLILNIAWAVYQRATLQYAALQGVRYAVTSQVISGLGQRASIQEVVQQNTFGNVRGNASGITLGTNGWNNIYVNWYQVDPNTGVVTDVSDVTGCSTCTPPTSPGNGPVNSVLPLVEVSVQNMSEKTFMPTIKMPGLGTLAPIVMTATAWDRMEMPPMAANGTQNPPPM
ncbi:MAG: TadE/TadG family type IV pilus assembly protein [Bryobacteraceae bacterium]|jgi:Flp pilus assembly protein TadG